MEDDDRETNWAPDRIRALEKVFDQLKRGIEEMSDNFTIRLNGLDKADGRKGNRLSELNERMSSLKKLMDSRTLSDDSRMKETELRMVQRIRRIEARLDAYGVPEHRDDEFSAPIGQNPEKNRKYQRDLDDELDGIPDVHGRRSPGFIRIPAEGTRHGRIFVVDDPEGGVVLTREIDRIRRTALEAAKIRVADVLKARGFSDEGILFEDIMKAIRG